MRLQAAGQEEILELVKNGECAEALERINKNQVRRFPPDYVSRLIFELIPQSTQPSKELEDLLLRYGKIKWDERNGEGRYLYALMIRYNRVDLSVKAVSGITRKDALDPALAPIWAGLLWWLLDKCQRTAAIIMIKKGVMKNMDDRQLKRVSEKILGYHDIGLLDTAHKYIKEIPPEILCMPETLAEQYFMREVLNSYPGMAEQKDREGKEKLWEICLRCNAEKMAAYLLKKTGDYQYLPRIAAGNDEMFQVLLNVRSRGILDEVKKEVLFGALSAEQWRQRFEMLVHRGWKKKSDNRKEDISLSAEYRKRIGEKRYSVGKKGHLEQINDQARVRFLVAFEGEERRRK